MTAEDVIAACGGEVPPEPELPEDIPPLPEPSEAVKSAVPGPLPWWREVGSVLSGALSVIVIYGGIMNPASALMWADELVWGVILTYCITGFPMGCVHTAATWLFLWFAAEPMLEKLDRIKVKYGLVK